MSFQVRTALGVAVLLLSAGAGGEIYRWTDEQGREHFTTHLQAVPVDQREAAHARAGDPEAGNITFHATRPLPSERPGRPEKAASATPKAPQASCDALKREIKRLMKPIRYHKRRLESNQRAARDITSSEQSRRRAEIRAEKSQAWLDKAEAEVDAFREAKRRQGALPGCLR